MKQQVYSQLLELLRQRAFNIKADLDSAIEARNNDTKSSAGDKHETGRAMIQQEIDVIMAESEKIKNMLSVLESIDPAIKTAVAGQGSLVTTNFGYYFIAIGFGRLQVNGMELQCISAASPIGQLLMGKHKGNTFSLADREYLITGIE